MKHADMQQTWLAPVLARRLGYVAAPEDLWDCIQGPRAVHRSGGAPRWTWVLAAAALAILAVWAVLPRSEFRSDRPAEIRAWIRRSTGLEVTMLEQPSPAIRIVSARVVKSDIPTVEIAYRAGRHPATLRVSKSDAPDSVRHQGADGSASWTMRGQTYLLACADPADLQVACKLCHSGS